MRYTFVEQMAAGAVAYPGKCDYSSGVPAGKIAPYGGSISDRKRLAGGTNAVCPGAADCRCCIGQEFHVPPGAQ